MRYWGKLPARVIPNMERGVRNLERLMMGFLTMRSEIIPPGMASTEVMIPPMVVTTPS